MNKWMMAVALAAVSYGAHAAQGSLTVYQDPNCGCCDGWVEHMREAGFEVNAIKTTQMARVKQQFNVPVALSSCHTGVVHGSGQIVEGHVPAREIHRLLKERPKALGLAVPGMPMGSPGMEMGDHRDAYQVIGLRKTGAEQVVAEYPAN